jgi:hypothetical protein
MPKPLSVFVQNPADTLVQNHLPFLNKFSVMFWKGSSEGVYPLYLVQRRLRFPLVILATWIRH